MVALSHSGHIAENTTLVSYLTFPNTSHLTSHLHIHLRTFPHWAANKANGTAGRESTTRPARLINFS